MGIVFRHPMLNEQIIKIPTLSFRLNSVLYYETTFNHRSRLGRSILFQQNAAKLANRDRYVGYVTTGNKKRMKKAITLLLQSTPYTYKEHPITRKTVAHKLSFITLTTPDNDRSRSASYCHKELLQPMLRYLRSKHGMKSYIWKCELQGNGQVHYHLTCDIMISHSELRNRWNALLVKKDMLDDFCSKYGHYNPNSTDIHNVRAVRNLEAYLVKYITKEYQNEQTLQAKIWDCSKNLKQGDYFKMEVDNCSREIIEKAQSTGECVTHYFDHAILFDFQTPDYYSFFGTNVVACFSSHLKKIRSWEKKEQPAQVPPINTPIQQQTSSTWRSKHLRVELRECQLILHSATGDIYGNSPARSSLEKSGLNTS